MSSYSYVRRNRMRCNHKHQHEHQHNETIPLILYLIGFLSFIVAIFVSSTGIKVGLFIIALITSGYHIIYEGLKDTLVQTLERRKFTPNIHLLMTLAAFGALAIGNFQEAALLILIFAGAHFLEHYAQDRSRREITNLLNLNPTEARLLNEDMSWSMVSINTLQIGDVLQVLNGDQVPTDGEIIEGIASINEASITGESIPKDKSTGDLVFGSTINLSGSFTMKVTKNPNETVFSKILDLVNESQNNHSQTASMIKRFEPRYVTFILILYPLFILFGLFIMKWDLDMTLYRSMVFLTVASPCALAASDIPATLSAMSKLARIGVLFKGGSYLSNLANTRVVAFDKTGTLTEGKPIVTDVYFNESLSEVEIQHYTNILYAMESTANHPLADAMIHHFNATETLNLSTSNTLGKGLTSNFDGKSYHIGKPDTYGEYESMRQSYMMDGKTVTYFGVDDQMIALIAMMDVAHSNALPVVSYLNDMGIETVMITGDALATGERVARDIGVTSVRADVHPEDKASIIDELKNNLGLTVMIGDGVNDAPALVHADIGFAMGDGTDIAIDVADGVLMQNDLMKFKQAHETSKRLQRIVKQNIFFSMFVVAVLVILNIMGQMSLPLGVIFHEGSTIVVILNGLRLLK